MKLADQLFNYLRKNPGPIASGDLQRIEWPKYAYGEKRGLHTPRSVVRRLEELAEEGKIAVEYRKNHSYYSIAESHKKPSYQYIFTDTGVKEVRVA